MRYAILIGCLLAANAACADTFKCQTRDGRTVFSDHACDKGEVIEDIQPAESTSDPEAARREVERQRAVADRMGAENDAARKRSGGAASLPDYSSPPPSWPPPTPLSPSSSYTR